MNLTPFQSVEIFRSRKRKACQERALVLQALGIPNSVERADGDYVLLVEGANAAAAHGELALYEDENVGWPPRREELHLLSRGYAGAVAYWVTLVAIYPIGRHGLADANWWEAGKVDAGRVLTGEWWRTITALTLHSDLRHLAGNLIFGTVFAVLASHVMGAGLGWLCTVLAGGLGNLANAWVQSSHHTAIGASTAVFGVLGVLAAYEHARRHTLRLPPMRRLGPLVGGALLLGFLGMSGENTDVVAHATGLGAGLFLGWSAGSWRLPERLGVQGQRWCGALAAAMVAVAWLFALL